MRGLRHFSILLSIFIVLMGCSLENDSGDDGLSEPEVSSAEDLPASEATAYPESKAEAVTLVKEVDEALSSAFNTNATTGTSNNRATSSDEEVLVWKGDYQGGTVDITGKINSSASYPDEDFVPETNTSYNDIISSSSTTEIIGTMSNIPLTMNSNEYTVSGEIDSTSSTEMSMDAQIGSTSDDVEIDIDYSLAIEHGFAASIKRADEFGAKIVITYAKEIEKTDLSISSMNDTDQATEDMLTSLDSIMINIQVYNDDNEIVGDYSVPLSEFYEESDFS